ncbi:MAG: gamma-glutamyltransferase [Planctomycetes bacterium]|nr:gamma-glutamyltransferase [Planctomycetota bacterium]MCB9918668.1 gamma-glutamyltransferase [Planctomycetota bacterium]
MILVRESTRSGPSTLPRAGWLAAVLPLGFVLGPPSCPNDQVARGTRAAVVSAEPHATDAGFAVLRSGGNAVDAAVAVAFALAVTHPQAGNLGGGGFLVLHTRDGKDLALDFRETAPRKAHRDMYLDADGRVIPRASTYTALAVGTPGSVAGLARAHALHGSKEWAELLVPAIKLARDGFEVSHFLASSLREKVAVLSQWPATAAIFLPDGEPLAAGTILRQPDLAATLQRIAEKGTEGFYTGETAKLVEASMVEHEGILDAEDLAAYRPIERQPLRGIYRGHTVLSMPPPSSGGVALLQMLNVLERYDVAAMGQGSSITLHLEIEAMKRAYADRAKWLGDPDFYPVPIDGLVAKDYAEGLAKDIDLAKATAIVQAGSPKGADLRESKETTHFSVLDAEGNAVSCTTTLNSTFGNGQVVAGAGFFLNNEMDDFSSKPGVPNQFGLVGAEANAIHPGKRMLSSMTPTIVLDADGKRPWLVLGSPGGGRIINTVFQVLSNVADHRLPLQDAVAAPRIHQQWLPRQVYWERLALPRDVREALEARGHGFRAEPTTIGRCQAILWNADGTIDAVSDPRSGGSARAF